MNDIPRRLWNYRHSVTPKRSQTDVVFKLRELGDHKCSLESYRKWESGITVPSEENQKKIDELIDGKKRGCRMAIPPE